MILLIDNYDSFVYNLSRYLCELGCETQVVRNDAATVAQIAALHPAAVVLSPGPCSPHEAGVCIELVQQLGARLPMLGVCLGHQVLATAFGGDVVRAAEPVHGRTSPVEHGGTGLFDSIPNPFLATRYHSLVVNESTLPAELRVTARTGDGVVMALEHTQHRLYGVQFHPESILTDHGRFLLRNFLRLADVPTEECLIQDLPAPIAGPDAELNDRLGRRLLHW